MSKEMRKVPSCRLCGKNAAVLPDRNKSSSRKEVCRDCHMLRLAGDLQILMGAKNEAS